MGTGSVFNPPNPPPTVFPSGYLVGSAPSCNDWVVFPTSTKGTNTQFNLIAFKNLYGGGSSPLCTSVPTVKFAYDVATNNGVGNPFLGSPTVSLDGTKIAVLEDGGTQGQFHVIKLPTTDSGPMRLSRIRSQPVFFRLAAPPRASSRYRCQILTAPTHL
jgi:hypothetical protein